MRCNMTDFGYQDKNRISFSYNSTDTDAKAQSFSNCGDTYNLVFVRSGSGKCVIEGREYPITAGSVLMGFSMFGYDFFVPENRLDEASGLLVPDGVAEEIAEDGEGAEEE